MSEIDDITSFLEDLKSSEEVIEPEYSQDNEEVKVENPNTGQSTIIKRDVVSDPRVLSIFSTDPDSDRYYQNFKSNNFHYILSDGIKVDYGSCSINDRVQIKEIMSRSDYLTNYDHYSLPFYVIGGRQLPVESTQISMTQVTNSVVKTVSTENTSYELWLRSYGGSDLKVACVKIVKDIFSLTLAEAKKLVDACPVKLADFATESEASSVLEQIESHESYSSTMEFDVEEVSPEGEYSRTSESQSQSQSQTTESYTASYVKYHLFTDKGEVIFTVDQYSVPQITAVKDLNEWFLDVINHVPIQSMSFSPYSNSVSSEFKYIRANLIQIGNDIYTLKVGYTQFIDFYRFLACLRKYKDQDKQNCFVSYLSDKVYSE